MIRGSRVLCAVLLVLVSMGLHAQTATWSSTGSMTEARYGHTATVLSDGRVLVVGNCTDTTSSGNCLLGNTKQATNTAELYDPATGTWTSIATMKSARFGHTATLLSDGTVLVAGGVSNTGIISAAEVYDPVAKTWTATGAMKAVRFGHTATLLPNGKVLVTGGTSGAYTSIAPLNTAELYDPVAKTWTLTAAMTDARFAHTATLLSNGKVLVVGGLKSFALLLGLTASSTAELYDPGTNKWSAAGTLVTAQYLHTASLLPNGQVLAAGGATSSTDISITAIANAELYDPVANKWAAIPAMNTAHLSHTSAVLPNGQVLVAGGTDATAILASAELYDPSGKSWTATGAMKDARMTHVAVLLNNGQVLVAGGTNTTGYLKSAELYGTASVPTTHTFTVTASAGGSVSDNQKQINACTASGGTCKGTYNSGTSVTLTATADTGYGFTSWSGDCTGTGTTATVTMSADHSCTATFTALPPTTYALTVTASAGGSVSDNQTPKQISACTSSGGTCKSAYNSGTSVTLTATADTGYSFTSWSGDCSGSGTTATVTMSADHSCTATFTALPPTTHALTVVASAGGSVSDNQSKISACTSSGGACNGSYTAGTSVILTATASAGYSFTGWSGDCTGTSTTATVTMSADHSCTATFTASPHTLTVV
ncbi:MAG: InlB B-repeat-containing protein, partial [Rhodanobacter sp.]|nr:InlB B-repeat-containing protein [Rhodanobacter sp.]